MNRIKRWVRKYWEGALLALLIGGGTFVLVLSSFNN